MRGCRLGRGLFRRHPCARGGGDCDVAAERNKLRVSTLVRVSQRFRICREVITEHLTVTVPIRREVIRVERLSPSPDPPDGADLPDGEVADVNYRFERGCVRHHAPRRAVHDHHGGGAGRTRSRTDPRGDTKSTVSADLAKESVELTRAVDLAH